MPQPTIRAVTFDLDGLMFNTELLYTQVGHELLRRRGKVYTKELMNRMMGRPGPIALQYMIDEHQLPLTIDQLLEESDATFDEILKRELAVMPGLFDLLELLEARGIPKGIATSSRRAYVDYILSRFELGPRFAFILSAEDVTHGKPDPEIYLKAARHHRVEPADMLVLEDSQTGCRAAIASGAFAVAVPGIHNEGHDYTGAAFIANSLADPRIREVLTQDRAQS